MAIDGQMDNKDNGAARGGKNFLRAIIGGGIEPTVEEQYAIENNNTARRMAWINSSVLACGIPTKLLYKRSVKYFKNKMEENYPKSGKYHKMDENLMVEVIFEFFGWGKLKIGGYTVNNRYLEVVMFAFFVELNKLGLASKYKRTLLHILASNHSEKSAEYGWIANDQVTRCKRK